MRDPNEIADRLAVRPRMLLRTPDALYVEAADSLRALAAENQQLREALQSIKRLAYPDLAGGGYEAVQHISRAALGEDTDA